MNDHLRTTLTEYREYWYTIAAGSPMSDEMVGRIDRLLETEFPLDELTLAVWLEELEGPNGCDFQEGEGGNITWTCRGGTDKSQSEAVLTSLGVEPDAIEIIHEYADVLGGHCSCEILFNAAERLQPAATPVD